MTGVPSIIMGIFGYILLVLPMKRFSAWAGVAALSMIFIPVVVRTTEEMLRTVPGTVREAALALDPWFVPVDHTIVGIVDGLNVTGGAKSPPSGGRQGT